ncbi:endonuclease domain-containing protein [Streptomyces sp. NPDC127038]|uniref:endonuclease domain-containing protein n=1 Tax=Streptomyces sp. NPDC127038 TaxID=3347114 RepID=UPI00365B542A
MKSGHASCYHTGYSLTCAEYDDLRRLAKGRCKICKAETARLFIDHDHALGVWAVRGLICHRCNQHLKVVDAGRGAPGPDVTRYLANAWHRRQRSSAAKAARVKAQRDCPACGKLTSVYANGNLHRHWSRLPGQHDTICPGATLPERPERLVRMVSNEENSA